MSWSLPHLGSPGCRRWEPTGARLSTWPVADGRDAYMALEEAPDGNGFVVLGVGQGLVIS